MTAVYVLSARRTAVMPIQGAFKTIPAKDLVIPVLTAVLSDADLSPDQVDQVILGNALYGGGNVARVAALGAGLPISTPAMTLDTQCCGGLDAIGLGAQLIKSGAADVVVAGGVESYSCAPRRFKRGMEAGDEDQEYDRPPFTPWPDRDPDMLAAAANLAKAEGISAQAQHNFAIESHKKALAYLGRGAPDIAALNGHVKDGASRRLTDALCARLPVIAGESPCGLTSASTALKADGAALLLLVSERIRGKLNRRAGFTAEYVDYIARGGDPENPALAPIQAIQELLARTGTAASEIALTEMMEAFAVQSMICLRETGLDARPYNVGGGALARGHPIGASGAINAVRLFHELQTQPAGSKGLAAIAAAGGLGSALMLRAP